VRLQGRFGRGTVLADMGWTWIGRFFSLLKAQRTRFGRFRGVAPRVAARVTTAVMSSSSHNSWSRVTVPLIVQPAAGGGRRPAWQRYNRGMTGDLFGRMKAYVSFGEADARALAEVGPAVRASFPAVVDHFYAVLVKDPDAADLIQRKPGRLKALRESLAGWLAGLFCGRYDTAYYHERAKIGRTHVRVGLPQHFMFVGMSILRQSLVEQIAGTGSGVAGRAVAALNKLLDLELAIMNETYREDLIHEMREIEQSQFEQKLSESEHLASVGALAASVAHEIKNPLAGISGAIQVLGAGLDEDHPHKEVITEVLHQIDRLDAAVRDLLIYARPKLPERTRSSLSGIVNRALMLLRAEPAMERVEVVCEGLDGECVAEVDAMQVQQVIANLMINAAHACEQGGRIRCGLSANHDAVRIVVEDNGVGIRPEVLPRIFEPFFTTKTKGTGLGLLICKRIVEAHGGTIGIESKPGAGTRVAIELPRTT